MPAPDSMPTAVSRASHARGPQRFRGLAAPAALLLIASFVSFAPGAADARTSGTLSMAPASGTLISLASSRLNSRTVVNLTVPASLPFRAAIQLRSASAAAGYRTSAGIASDGALTVTLSRVANGRETTLGSSPTGVTAKPGQVILLQGAIAGSTPVRLYVRAWINGARTPRWQLAALDYDGARIRTPGKTRLWGSLSGSATASARVRFSKVSTARTSVASVKSYKVRAWVPKAPGVAAPATPTPTRTPVITPTPTPTPTPTAKPSADTTGVKAGTVLTRHDGDITVTTDGTVLDQLDIHGFVIVRAKNVTISNSIVRGGVQKGFATGLITDYGYQGLLVTDTTIKPEFPSVWFDGIKGSGFTARRVHITGGVDSIKIQGTGASTVVENSLLENTDYFASDPQQSGGPTHNDNIQVQNGRNVRITGNTIRGATNFAVLGAAAIGDTNLVVDGNWLDGGHCTVKLQLHTDWAETATVTDNKFGPNRLVSSCAFTSYPNVTLTQGGNTFELTGGIVNPLVVVS